MEKVKRIVLHMNNGESFTVDFTDEKYYHHFLEQIHDKNIKDNEFIIVDFSKDVDAGMCLRKGSIEVFTFYEDVKKVEKYFEEKIEKVTEEFVEKLFKGECEDEECDCNCDCNCDDCCGHSNASDETEEKEEMRNPFLK